MTAPIPIRTLPPAPAGRVSDLAAAMDELRAEIAALTAALRTLTPAVAAPTVPSAAAPPAQPLRFAGGLTVDLAAGEAYLDGVALRFARREYELLAHLACHPRRLFTRAQFLEQVWGTRFQDPSTVTEHIRRIRTRIGLPVITTVRAGGYRWDARPLETSR
ncbi:winged helix-turn-helix domain-containing protein [Candidatus Frankia nodulisporulans]|uniref:winged helix-turn-helix domain-containing protein n=1 Tax=Candidatus Frankia nodulisporulans TaxID=2060052 RepID=UPI001CDD491D|nr:winged helix-turn-helix domain-containing protein [Candidatus Frankia nodulisporulans]